MPIELIAKQPRDSERQIAFIKVDGTEFSVGNVPVALTKTEDIQAHLDARADEFKLLILRKSYPESDHLQFQKEDMTEFQSIKAWITAGHKNKIQIGLTLAGNPKYGYKVIEKQELQYRHPKSVKLMAMIDTANIAPEMKDLLKEIAK